MHDKMVNAKSAGRSCVIGITLSPSKVLLAMINTGCKTHLAGLMCNSTVETIATSALATRLKSTRKLLSLC